MNDLQQAVSLLIKGEVIVLPVEGTYCFVADPFNAAAVEKLAAIALQQTVKQQPVMLVGDFEDLPRLVNGFSDTEEQNILNNWPSDKTIVFSSVQMGVNAKLKYKSKSIALRMPSEAYILEVLHAVGQPLASFVVYNDQMPAKDRRDLLGIDNFILKLPMSLSGKESEVIES
jgi:tRNA A37 threonylcarbamoyladenosine synthetase subunit TsaC/SUA5/YrdC